MNKRLDVMVDGKFIGTFADASIAFDALCREIEVICDDLGADYPTFNEDLMFEDFEIVLEEGGYEAFYIDNTIVGVDTGEYVDFHVDIYGGIDRF